MNVAGALLYLLGGMIAAVVGAAPEAQREREDEPEVCLPLAVLVLVAVSIIA